MEQGTSEYWDEYWQKKHKVMTTRLLTLVALSAFAMLMYLNFSNFSNMENARKFYENEYRTLYANYTCIPTKDFVAARPLEKGCMWQGSYVAVCPNQTDVLNLSIR